MDKLFKTLLLSLVIAVGISACKKAEEETAEKAKEVIMDMKENTIDAAKEAAAATEDAAKATAAATDEAIEGAKESAEDAVEAAKNAANAK